MAIFTVYFGSPGEGNTKGVIVDEKKFSSAEKGMLEKYFR